MPISMAWKYYFSMLIIMILYQSTTLYYKLLQ